MKKCTYIHTIEHFSAMSTAPSRMFKHLLGKLLGRWQCYLGSRSSSLLTAVLVTVSYDCCPTCTGGSERGNWLNKQLGDFKPLVQDQVQLVSAKVELLYLYFSRMIRHYEIINVFLTEDGVWSHNCCFR